jgi:HEAT repeat protein
MVQHRNAVSDNIGPWVKRGQAWYHKQLARRQMGTAGNPVSEQSALASLQDIRPKRRWEAARSLGKRGLHSEQAVAALSAALSDPEPFVRWQAAEALAIQDPGKSFPVLRSLLTDLDPLQRAGAADALGRMGGEAATVELRKALADPEPAVRTAAARALGSCGDLTAGEALLPLLEDDDPEVVRGAARAFGQIGDARAACSLAEVLVRPGQPLLVRRALAAALARAPHPEVQSTLFAVLQDPDPQVRGYAAVALGQIGTDAAWQPLAAAREDVGLLLNGTVGEQAARALAQLERRGHHAPEPADHSATRNTPANGG